MSAVKYFLLVASVVGVAGCGKGMSDPIPKPPGGGYVPPDPGSGGYGSGSGGGGAGVPTGPPMCDPSVRVCAHPFTYGPNTLTGHEKAVILIGDYRSDSWTNGDPMTFDGSKWVVTVGVPWAKQVIYKFHIQYNDGTADKYLPDPNNPTQVPDGFGGFNSVFAGTTCATWTCGSTQISCSAAPVAAGSFDWRDAVIYWAFVDRFVDGDPTNNAPSTDGRLTGTAANWQGGDWKGLTSKITDGYLASLGVNTIWITVPTDSSQSVGQGVNGDTFWYTGYHGYWPRDLTKTEAHWGAAADLTTLVTTAHNAGIKIIADYTMKHVHTDSPIWQAHMSDGWFNPLVQNGQTCVCNVIGGDPCNYDGTLGKSCWFASYLPAWNFNNAAARAYSIGNALMWIQTYKLDGFRLDAIKQIEPIWITDFRAQLLSQVEATTKQHVYLVGETFSGDRNLIKSFISPCTELDGQFDFPERAQVVQHVLMRQGKMGDLVTFMDANTGFYGQSVMSTFLGNHDVPRAIHFADDTPLWSDPWASGKDRNWSNQPGQPASAGAYERLAVGFAVLWTNIGAPMIYYGDEIGLAGAGDPDNRRMMTWSGYSTAQAALLAKVKTLGKLRAMHTALRRGTRTTLSYDDDSWVYQMVDGSDRVYVAVNRSDATKTVGGLPAATLTDQMTNQTVTGPSVSVPPRSARVMTP